MANQRTLSRGVDSTLILLTLLLVVVGLLCIFSVEYRSTENIFQNIISLKKNYSRQLLFIGISAVFATFILLTDSKFFTATANIAYVLGIFLMVLTIFIGKDINGSKSWIPLGFFNLQPVETCKIFTALALAKYLARPETNFEKPRSQLIAAGLALLPIVLAIMQKETGLALVYFAFVIPMYREGLPAIYLIIGISLTVLVVATIIVEKNTLAIALTALALAAVYFMQRHIRRDRRILAVIVGVWLLCVGIQRFAVPYIFQHVLKPYQVERILSTFGVDYVPADETVAEEIIAAKEKEQAKKPNEDKDNYNVKQSKIAIGSGGFWGKGFLKGTQTQGEFVPEQHTDFIFTSVGENFGFWGSTVLALVYLFLLLRIIVVAERQRSTFSRVYGYSIAGILFFHIAINIGMTIGLAPVIGITLPFMSYGGSSLLSFTILVFILIKLDADRQMVLR